MITAEDWAATEDATSSPADDVKFAFDMSPDRHVSIAVSAESSNGGVHLELVERRQGTKGLARRLKQLQDDHGGVVAISVGSPAWSLEGELVDEGVELLEVSTAEHAQACERFRGGVLDREVRHRNSPDVEDALAGATKRMAGDAWLWSRKNSGTDISPLVAFTLAHHAHHQAPAPVDWFKSVW